MPKDVKLDDEDVRRLDAIAGDGKEWRYMDPPWCAFIIFDVFALFAKKTPPVRLRGVPRSFWRNWRTDHRPLASVAPIDRIKP